MSPIFPPALLQKALHEYRLSTVPGIRVKRAILNGWLAEVEAGKLAAAKEEEVKARFVTDFFGNVLGFNYTNAKEWQLREEAKTKVDGTKPDAVLGYFTAKKSDDDVRVVIEIKDANTNLDDKQKRKDTKSAVDQAFEYAPKMGGHCAWVVVSNMIETRFYAANDRSRYQVFSLKELAEEEKLKELLFLFHKDHLIKKNGEASTDKLLAQSKSAIGMAILPPAHIVDELYYCAQKFTGLNCVDPHFLASIYPFNILSEHVWHYELEERSLLTLNDKIYELLQGVDVTEGKVRVSESLQEELDKVGVVDAEVKLEQVFKFLNRSQIQELKAVKDYHQHIKRNKNTIGASHRHTFSFMENEGITKQINLSHPTKECDCLQCTYQSLDFNKFLKKLSVGTGKAENDTLEYAYANYLAGSQNFRIAHDIYQRIEQQTKGKQGQAITYFLAKLNRLYLHNLLWQDGPEGEEMLRDIRAIDLARTVYEELEFEVDADVRGYLTKLHEQHLIYQVQDELLETVASIQKRKKSYKRNSTGMQSWPNYEQTLLHQYHLLYAHSNANYIISDVFIRYRKIASMFVKALVNGYRTPGAGLVKFSEFMLSQAVLHINSSDLRDILSKVKKLRTSKGVKATFLKKVINILVSTYKDGIFNDPQPNAFLQEALLSYQFSEQFTNTFSNLLTILSKLKLSRKDITGIPVALNKYLQTEPELAWHDIDRLAEFIARQGQLFEEKELADLLRIALKEGKHGAECRYPKLIRPISKTLQKNFPFCQITDKSLVRQVIARCYAGDKFRSENFVHLWPLLNEPCQMMARQMIESSLDEQFEPTTYDPFIRYGAWSYTRKDYFSLYVKHINETKGKGLQKGEDEKYQFKGFTFFNFALLLYIQDIDRAIPELQQFTDLSLFEQWLLNPEAFDYENFKAEWVVHARNLYIMNGLRHIKPLRTAVERALLKKKQHALLSKVYREYFAHQEVPEQAVTNS